MVIASVLFVECLFLNFIYRSNGKIPNMIGAAKMKDFREAHTRSKAANWPLIHMLGAASAIWRLWEHENDIGHP